MAIKSDALPFYLQRFSAMTEVTGFCVFGRVRFGANGNGNSSTECLVGRSSSSQITTRKQWQASVQDNVVDSDWVSVKLTARAGGTDRVRWAVDGASTPLEFSGVSYGEITGVTFQAGVIGPGKRVSFDNITISLFTSDTATVAAESWPFTSEDLPPASTIGSSEEEAEGLLEFTPDGSGYYKVVIDADIRLENDGTEAPAPDDLFAGIYIYASNCSS